MNLAIYIYLLFISFLSEEHPLYNKPAPQFNFEGEKTEVDYTGKVTLVNFMYIGCKPCMEEIKSLNKLYQVYKKEVQFISIAAQTRKQLDAFLSDDKSIFSTIRFDFKSEKPIYPLYAECSEERKDKNDTPEHRTLGPECHVISNKFFVDGYPYTFLIDKKGIVRFAQFGFPMLGNDSTFMNKIKAKISELTNE